MTIVAQAVYKDGILYLMEDVDLQNGQTVRVVVQPIDYKEELEQLEEISPKLVEQQQRALREIIGIGNSGKYDISQRVDDYLYVRE